jgi:hypothetical protein
LKESFRASPPAMERHLAESRQGFHLPHVLG